MQRSNYYCCNRFTAIMQDNLP